MTDQNFYVVEKFTVNKKQTAKKQAIDNAEQDWNTKYGLENNNGLIQKDIHW